MYKFLILIPICILSACASPAQKINQLAAEYQFKRIKISGDQFNHIAYLKGDVASASTVHVYLEGDGRAWIRKHQIATDPTPLNPVMLKLMALDNQPSVYLGRPCYFGLSTEPACHTDLWTNRRYSQEVVNSMVAALHNIIAKNQTVVLMGYSGGGTLAMLMAESLPNVTALITLAGNLDIDAWTQLHGYSPLTGSLNPVGRAPLRKRINQWHIAGGKDDNMPAEYIKRALQHQPAAQFLVRPQHNHYCCWEKEWAGILNSLL